MLWKDLAYKIEQVNLCPKKFYQMEPWFQCYKTCFIITGVVTKSLELVHQSNLVEYLQARLQPTQVEHISAIFKTSVFRSLSESIVS